MIRWMPLQCTASAAFGVCWLAVSSIGARAWSPGIEYDVCVFFSIFFIFILCYDNGSLGIGCRVTDDF